MRVLVWGLPGNRQLSVGDYGNSNVASEDVRTFREYGLHATIMVSAVIRRLHPAAETVTIETATDILAQYIKAKALL